MCCGGGGVGNASPTSMMCLALSMEACVSKENRASTSVDTRPGTMARISLPNSTSSRSRHASTFSSIEPSYIPCQPRHSVPMSHGPPDLVFRILHGDVHQLGVLRLLRRRQDERRVRRGILRLVFGNCWSTCQHGRRNDTPRDEADLLAKSPESQTTVCEAVSTSVEPAPHHPSSRDAPCQWLSADRETKSL